MSILTLMALFIGEVVSLQPPPLKVGRFTIRSFEEADFDRQPGTNEIFLSDCGLYGASWGDGEHPTTRMCLEFLHERVTPGMNVLDWGTGSGVLSIFVCKEKGARCVGVELDYASIDAAIANAKMNGLVQDELDVIHTREVSAGEFGSRFDLADVAVANIRPGPLTRISGELYGATRPGGLIALSGLRTKELASVREAYLPFVDPASEDTRSLSTIQAGEWVLWSARTITDADQRMRVREMLSDLASR